MVISSVYKIKESISMFHLQINLFAFTQNFILCNCNIVFLRVTLLWQINKKVVLGSA